MVLVCAVLGGAYVLLTRHLTADLGLTLTVYEGVGDDRRALIARRTPTVDSSVLANDPALPRRFFSATWTGVWHVPASGFYDVSVSGGDRVTVRIDDQLVHAHSVARPARSPRTVEIEAGFRRLEVDFEQFDGTSAIRMAWAPAGEPPRAIPAEALLPEMPRYPPLRASLEALRTGMRLAGIAGLVASGWIGLIWLWRRLMSAWEDGVSVGTSRRVCRVLAVALPVIAVMYGAALRFDSVTLKYGPVERPGWLRVLQDSRGPQSLGRPDAVNWTPVGVYPHRDGPPSRYRSDPYTYLQYAREMGSFYDAHSREPLFPFVTKQFLALLDDQDVAVSFASASMSVGAILATFLLGAYAFSYWVGLGAAFAMAIEYDVISWGVEGWRDDAFTCAVILSAWTMLRFHRVPSRERAIAIGMVAGLACLVRITSLSYLLPGLVYLLVSTTRPWRERLIRLRTLIDLLSPTSAGSQFVVPLPMERVGYKGECVHLRCGDRDARGVRARVKLRRDPQGRGRPCVADEVHDGLERREGCPAPVLGDVAEEPMLDFVPLARAGGGK